MRTLTVKRKFGIVECATRVFLYVQCPKSKTSEKINGITCRKVGRLKNGKSLTVGIPDGEQIVFFKTAYWCTPYKIYAAQGDVRLRLTPHYNPADGNRFTIDAM